MYAIIQTGGKQFRVEKGMKLKIEKLPQEAGANIELGEVLLVSGENGDQTKIGQPFVSGSKVAATIVRHLRGPKVIIFKKRSKKGYRKTQGHRQEQTEIEIKDILA
jgi:large subunit ribosomal protein L21